MLRSVQIRVMPNTCAVPKEMQSQVSSCYDAVNAGDIDQDFGSALPAYNQTAGTNTSAYCFRVCYSIVVQS